MIYHIRIDGVEVSSASEQACSTRQQAVVALLEHPVLTGLRGSCRFFNKLPRYNQMINALTWMSHAQNLRRMSRDYVIDMYLQPPVTRFRLMDFHLMDRIVRNASR